MLKLNRIAGNTASRVFSDYIETASSILGGILYGEAWRFLIDSNMSWNLYGGVEFEIIYRRNLFDLS